MPENTAHDIDREKMSRMIIKEKLSKRAVVNEDGLR